MREQGPHHADFGMHQWPALFGCEHESLDRGLPSRLVGRGFLKLHQRLRAGDGNGAGNRVSYDIRTPNAALHNRYIGSCGAFRESAEALCTAARDPGIGRGVSLAISLDLVVGQAARTIAQAALNWRWQSARPFQWAGCGIPETLIPQNQFGTPIVVPDRFRMRPMFRPPHNQPVVVVGNAVEGHLA